MKLTEEQVAKIEAVLATYIECGQRAAIIEHDIADLTVLSGLVSCLRQIGIPVPRRRGRATLSGEDALAFRDFMRQRAASRR